MKINFITRLLTPKDDIIRHQILEMIFDKSYGSPNRTLLEKDIAVTFNEISQKIGKPEKEIHYAAFGLNEDEAHIRDFGNGICICAWVDTYSAYSTKKYLKQGRTHVLNRIKDYLGITTAIIAVITATIAVATALISITSNQRRITTLEKEVKQLKVQSSQSNLLKSK